MLRGAGAHRDAVLRGDFQHVLDAEHVDAQRELRVALADGGQQRREVQHVRDAVLHDEPRERLPVRDVAVREGPARREAAAVAHVRRDDVDWPNALPAGRPG